MPLHRHHEIIPRHLDGLDHPVGVAGADHQTLTETVNALVVVTLDRPTLADQRGQPGARHGTNRRG